MNKENKIIHAIKILVSILVLVALILFIIYKNFGIKYFPWLSSFVGPQTCTVEFKKNGADWISSERLSCNTDETMTCKVRAPEIIRKGALIIGWAYEDDSKKASFLPGDEIILDSKNTIFYAITVPRIDVARILQIDSVDIEFEENLVYAKNIEIRAKSLNKLYGRWPFLFKQREKVSVLTASSFKKYNNVDYSGANHWGERYIDIKEANSDYTIIHELAHALDFNCTKGLHRLTYEISGWRTHKYETKFNYDSINLISESPEYDFVNLYNKYKNAPHNNRPLKDYSYTDEHEFFADSLTYYYDYKYENQYYNLMNKEIIAAVENLIKDINSGKICTNVIEQEFRLK